MCFLELSKVIMYEFHYDYIKNKYDNKSKLLFTDTDSLMYEIKTRDVYDDFSSSKEMFDFTNYSTKSKYCDNSNKLFIDKMKDKIGGLRLKIMVGDDNEHKKAKGVYENVVATISQNEFKGALLNNKCLRHSTNRIQSKGHRIGTYEINKISLSCFDDKIYIQNNVNNGLALSYQS